MTIGYEPAVEKKKDAPANKKNKQRCSPGIIRECYKSLFNKFQGQPRFLLQVFLQRAAPVE
ncbi:MAG: hypothetical protein EA359_15905 [Balneolaceae bacterium]|nr:MAG: hypothetical protein EA359_15905 [Balneolaceae bacterium]